MKKNKLRFASAIEIDGPKTPAEVAEYERKVTLVSALHDYKQKWNYTYFGFGYLLLQLSFSRMWCIGDGCTDHFTVAELERFCAKLGIHAPG